MWLPLQQLDDASEMYAQVLGKALLLTQNYEQNCKFVFNISELDSQFEEGKISTLKDIREASTKLLYKLQLNKAISKMEKHGVTKEELYTLSEGRNSRNYIAHEAALHLILGLREITKHFETMQEHIRKLATADNLVSRWCYLIQEKEYPYWSTDKYVTEVMKWVFPSDLNDFVQLHKMQPKLANYLSKK